MKRYEKPKIGYNRRPTGAVPALAFVPALVGTVTVPGLLVGVGVTQAAKALGDNKLMTTSSLDEVIA